LPFIQRFIIIKALWFVDDVVHNIDRDGSSVDSLRWVSPQKFAKGGDRTPDNMPHGEIEVCKELGIELVYGIGDRVDSSQDIVKRCCQNLKSKPKA